MKPKNYRKIIAEQALNVVPGSFLIKVEVPIKKLNQWRDEYKTLKGIAAKAPWDFDKEDKWRRENAFLQINASKWDAEYRVYFNSTPEDLERLKIKFGDRIKKVGGKGRAAYLYRLDDNNFARELLKNGAEIGVNNFPLPLV